MKLPSTLQLTFKNISTYTLLAQRAIDNPFSFKRELLQLVIFPATLIMVLSILSGAVIGSSSRTIESTDVPAGQIEATLHRESGTNSIVISGPLRVEDGLLTFSFSGSELFVAAPSELTLTEDTLQLESGIALIRTAERIRVALPEQQLELATGQVIIVNADDSSFTILAGGQQFGESSELLAGETVSFAIDNPEITAFDRQLFSRESAYKSLAELLSTFDMLPQELSDLKPPPIADVIPGDNATINEIKVKIEGRTEPEATVTINQTSVSVAEDGSFSKVFELKEGTNTFNILARDSAGNTTTVKRTYTRSATQQENNNGTPAGGSETGSTPATPAPAQAQSCSGNFTQTLLCLINNHRQQNGKGTLMLHGAMSQAAQDHSDWMSANATLSHTGEGGSSPWDRCADAGTTCDAENVAQNSNPTAQNIFNQWKNSSGHNENMLGSHTRIGIGISDGYATAVFQ
ncbi:MAG: Cysteine-rich secretory protein family protein [candidate division WS6 bacterium OLB20]|uniref:Cysteine-rich secretory protein family protein n=1 Tax=candidate division WS6 bacterium OLB20 TaxID=1617426 RepID=A0A136LXT9_9BACT|nr:MAG: Cysteine-rich secretory protein family protein [candidate division WS6 bacterium OLB20]